MPAVLIEVPVAALSIDETRCPDRDESQILGHLVRYCAKFDPLPAVTVALEGEEAWVVRGHKYLLAARELGRARLRAVVASPPPSSPEVERFLARAGVEVLDWERIKAAEQLEPTPTAWHVFFFERPLTAAEKQAFEDVTRALFSDPELRVVHDEAGPVAEFEAPTPVTDHAWASAHLGAYARFARQQVRIVSYQGRRFPVSVSPGF